MSRSGIRDLVPASLRQAWVDEGIYPNRSLYDLFKQRVAEQPDHTAVFSPHECVTYAELLGKAQAMAAFLKEAGIVAGDVVAYQLFNSWRCCAIDLAVAALGAIALPFPLGRGRLEMESMLKRSSARALIVERFIGAEDVCEMVEQIRPRVLSLRVLVVQGAAPLAWAPLDACWAKPCLDDQTLPCVNADEPARFLVSSGTESEPKLVAYSHNALLGGRGQFMKRVCADGASFRGLYLVPLGSAFGATATAGVLCCLGGSLVLLPKFEVGQAIAALERFHPSHVLGVPTMIQRMAADAALATTDTSSVNALVCGGSVVDRSTVERSVAAFGCHFISLYGSADGMNCHTTPDDHIEHACHTVGRPNPLVCDLLIVDEQGQALPQGEIGEIMARGPISPMQYVNAPDLDAQYRNADGWVRSGDLGLINPEGYLVLAGRKKDIIIRGGVNISTVQIEQCVMTYPSVVSAVCVPVADPDMGQRVCVCISLKDGAVRPSLQQLADHLRSQGLDVNKLPEYLRFVRHLPMSPAGKVDKKRLEQELHFLGAVC